MKKEHEPQTPSPPPTSQTTLTPEELAPTLDPEPRTLGVPTRSGLRGGPRTSRTVIDRAYRK